MLLNRPFGSKFGVGRTRISGPKKKKKEEEGRRLRRQRTPLVNKGETNSSGRKTGPIGVSLGRRSLLFPEKRNSDEPWRFPEIVFYVRSWDNLP